MPAPGGRPSPDQNAGQDGGGGGGGKNPGHAGGGGGGGGKPKHPNRNRVGVNNRIGYAYAYFIAKGLSPGASAGIVGNLKQESGVDPNNDQDPAWGPGRGIAQWSAGGRWDVLLSWARAHNKDPRDLRTQLDFVWHELNTGYTSTLSVLKNTNDIGVATRVFMEKYEIPAAQYANLDGRISFAQDVYNNQDATAKPRGMNNAATWSGGEATNTGGGGGTGGGSGGGGTAGSPGQHDNLTKAELAEKYGWALSFLKSNKELWGLFQKANNKDWSQAQFIAQLRSTDWFQNHSASWREAQYLQKTDPTTYKSNVKSVFQDLRDQAAAMGAQLSGEELRNLAEQVYRFGYNPSQVRDLLAEEIRRKNGSFLGDAGAVEDTINQYAQSMGVRVSNQWVKRAVTGMASGDWSDQQIQDHIRNVAISSFPTFADELKNTSMTVRDIAEPYIQSMSSILELNPAQVDLYSPKIRKALTGKGEDGKPQAMGLYDFEVDLRKDPRWLQTRNGEESVNNALRTVMQDFGLGY